MTTMIQGGRATIYNLPGLLCDGRGGLKEGERVRRRHTRAEGGRWIPQERTDHGWWCFIFPPRLEPFCDQCSGEKGNRAEDKA